MSTALRPNPIATPFSPEQERALAALMEGATIADAAKQAGVAPITLYLWARVHQPLHEALKNCRCAKAGLIRHQQEDLAQPALATMERLITDEKVPAAVQFKASQAILQLATQPDAEWLIDAPKSAAPSSGMASAPVAEPTNESILKELDELEDLDLDDEDEDQDDEDYGPVTSDVLAEVDAFIAEWQAKLSETEEPKPAANEAPEPVQTIRREGPKIGRNEQCPCDSGKKFKKCCGSSVPAL